LKAQFAILLKQLDTCLNGVCVLFRVHNYTERFLCSHWKRVNALHVISVIVHADEIGN
jgi:hypothetical protein